MGYTGHTKNESRNQDIFETEKCEKKYLQKWIILHHNEEIEKVKNWQKVLKMAKNQTKGFFEVTTTSAKWQIWWHKIIRMAEG